MYYYISGELVLADPVNAVIDAQGVGYRLNISGTTLGKLAGKIGSNVRLYTHLSVREDAMELYGFYTLEELASFRMLISVSGVGPKAAISILSQLTPQKLAVAICSNDTKTIAKSNGIGPKTAARIVLELKDKLQKEAMVLDADDLSMMADQSPAAAMGKKKDAEDALTVLGYSRSEASAALRSIDTEKLELDDIIRLALKKLMR